MKNHIYDFNTRKIKERRTIVKHPVQRGEPLRDKRAFTHFRFEFIHSFFRLHLRVSHRASSISSVRGMNHRILAHPRARAR